MHSGRLGGEVKLGGSASEADETTTDHSGVIVAFKKCLRCGKLSKRQDPLCWNCKGTSFEGEGASGRETKVEGAKRSNPRVPEPPSKPSEPPSGPLHPIQRGIIQVNGLVVELGRYYMAHPAGENKLMVEVAAILTAHNLALEHLVRCSLFREAEVQKLIDILKPVNPKAPSMLAQLKREVATLQQSECDELKHNLANQVMETLNSHAALGRHLLKDRELRAQGMSEDESLLFLKSWNPENPF